VKTLKIHQTLDPLGDPDEQGTDTLKLNTPNSKLTEGFSHVG
jgi:hypothetical protein